MTAQHRAEHVRNNHNGFLIVIASLELVAIAVLGSILWAVSQ